MPGSGRGTRPPTNIAISFGHTGAFRFSVQLVRQGISHSTHCGNA